MRISKAHRRLTIILLLIFMLPAWAAAKKAPYEGIVVIGDSLSDMRDAETADVPFLGRVLPGHDVYFPENIKYIHDFSDLIR